MSEEMIQTIDISGFGGGYEATCQKMLRRGLKFLEEHPNFDFHAYRAPARVFGVCIGEGEDAKALDQAITEGMDATGAMHHSVISHLAYIHKHTYEGWLTEAKKQGRKIIETTEEEIENEILYAHIEFQLKHDGGYNPVAELFKMIPLEDLITVDVNDPQSVREAVREIARRINKADET